MTSTPSALSLFVLFLLSQFSLSKYAPQDKSTVLLSGCLVFNKVQIICSCDDSSDNSRVRDQCMRLVKLCKG